MTLRGILILLLLPAIGCVTPAVRREATGPELAPARMEPLVSWPQEAPAGRELSAPPLVEVRPEEPPPSEMGLQLARSASRYVGLKSLRKVTREVTDDCSGFVRLVYHSQGIELFQDGFLPSENGVAAIHRRAQAMGAFHLEEPRPGDLVFFHDTYDRNRNGRHDDAFTHIGVVESVDGEGTVTFIHRYGLGVARSRLNVGFPHERAGPDGRVFNDYISRATRKEKSLLAGQLFSGYASPDRL